MSSQSIDRVEIKLKAKSILEGNWPISIGVILIYFLFTVLLDHFIGFLGVFGLILNVLITPALILALMTFFVKSAKSNLFSFTHMKINFKMYFKMLIFVFLLSLFYIPQLFLFVLFFNTSSFLWIIISIIIIAFNVYLSLALFSVPFILIESNGEKSLIDSVKESYNLTKGHVINLFVFSLSFLGWQIVCIFSLCIGFLWLIPYVYVAEYLYFKKLQNIKFSEIDSIKLD